MRGAINGLFWSIFLITSSLVGSQCHHNRLAECKIPFRDVDFTQLALRISTDFHTQGRGLDILASAEAFALHPISASIDISTTPNKIIVTDPHISQLIEAVNSRTAVGRADLIDIFKRFGINGKKLADSLAEFIFAGEQYSIAVANSIPSEPYLAAWLAAASKAGSILAKDLEFKKNSKKYKQIIKLFQEAAKDEANAILGLNELLPASDLLPGETQADAAMRFFILNRAATTLIGDITFEQLIINYNKKPCQACEKF